MATLKKEEDKDIDWTLKNKSEHMPAYIKDAVALIIRK
jgi:hypothetical protein